MAQSAATLIASAMAAGYAALSDRDLKECLLYAAQSGGGGGGGLSGVGSPQGVVTGGSGQTYLDTSTGNFWVNTNGTITGWIELISS